MSDPFYGKKIDRSKEAEYVKNALKTYNKQPVNEELRRTIYEALMHEKFLGNITIPFAVVLRKDPSGRDRDYIEVIIESKV